MSSERKKRKKSTLKGLRRSVSKRQKTRSELSLRSKEKELRS